MKVILLQSLMAIFCCILPFDSVSAVTMDDLYQVELPVSSQSPETRAEAIKEGFTQVLIKVAGDSAIIKNPLIQSSLGKADYYVQEFGYLISTTSSYQYHIQIKYDANDINRLLKKADASYWGTNRPLILVWLAVSDKKDNANIISNEDPSDILATMKQEGKKLGIPLIFPMMDMTDMDQATVQDIRDMSLSVLQNAGKRYAPDALLVGELKQNNDGYESQWQLVFGKNQWDWTIADKTVDNVIQGVLNQVNQALSKSYAVKAPSSSQQWLKVEVTHITERNDLEQLLQYLNQLTSVEQVRLSEVAGSIVELSILVRGSPAAFEQNAAQDERLVLNTKDEANNRLVYEWTH